MSQPPNPTTSASSARTLLSRHDAIWDMNESQLRLWIQTHAKFASAYYPTLETSLKALHETQQEIVEERNDDEEDEQASKKKRRVIVRTLHDPFHLWLQAWKQAAAASTDEQQQDNSTSTTLQLPIDADDIPQTIGGKLSQLSLGGIINALAGAVVTSKGVPTAQSLTSEAHKELYETAVKLHRAVQTKLQADILVTTPLRIQEMLANDLTPHEFAAIRRRIYDTVILGKGVGMQDADEDEDVVAATRSQQHEIEQFKKCQSCGNNDQSAFVLDRKNGDVICDQCGTVVSESLMHEGSAYRKFEGEADRNHHGDAPNPLYSNAHNMSTTLGGVSQVSGAGIGGWGSGNKGRNLETILRNAHAYTELNVSQFGKTDRRTRTGYKDKQKKEAFMQMAHVGDALNLHEAVVQRAKELFAGFRDDRELVQQFKGVIGTYNTRAVGECLL